MIGDSLLWETLLVQIRGVCIRYAAEKKRDRCNWEALLIKKIDQLSEKCNSTQYFPNKSEELKNAQEELVSIRNEKLQGSKIRSGGGMVRLKGKNLQAFTCNWRKAIISTRL